MDGKARRGRWVFAGIAATLLFGAIASVGAALSPSSPGAAAKQYPKGKVTICHHTHSKKHPFVTIRVSVRALKAHMKHGDTIGPCSQQKKHKKKHGKHHGQQSQHANQQGSHGRHKGNGKPGQSQGSKKSSKHSHANSAQEPANPAVNGNREGRGKPDAGKPGTGKPVHPGEGHRKK
jgi:hypothetical protein